MSEREESTPFPEWCATLPSDDFACLGIAPQFPVDIAMLDRAYRDRQAECHPDHFTLDDSQTRDAATLWTSRVNDAYRRLRDPQTAAETLCKLRFSDAALEEARGDPAFLVRVLDWHEAIEAAAAADDLGRLNSLSDELREAISSCFASVIAGFDANDAQSVVTAIVHWKYLKKALDDLADKIDRVIG